MLYKESELKSQLSESQSLYISEGQVFNDVEFASAVLEFIGNKSRDEFFYNRGFLVNGINILDYTVRPIMKPNKDNIIAEINIHTNKPEIMVSTRELFNNYDLILSIFSSIEKLLSSGNSDIQDLANIFIEFLKSVSRSQNSFEKLRDKQLRYLCDKITKKSNYYEFGYITSSLTDIGITRNMTIKINARLKIDARNPSGIIMPLKKQKFIMDKFNKLKLQLKENKISKSSININPKKGLFDL